MRYIISILLITVSLSVKAQQEIELCPNVRNTFNYWANASTSSGGWLWTLNSDTISTNSNVRITWRDTGYYLIRVYYKDECGNPTRIYRVKVVKCPESAIFFPNAFTPNGDGLNDAWSPIPFKITEIRCRYIIDTGRWFIKQINWVINGMEYIKVHNKESLILFFNVGGKELTVKQVLKKEI